MYRARRDADATKRAEYLKNKQEKYKNDILNKKRKTVSSMTERELRQQRGEWRKRQRVCRSRRKVADAGSDDEMLVSSTVSTGSSATSSRGRRRIQRNKSALYRENMHLHSELLKYKRKSEKYKKRCSRMKQSHGRVVTNSMPRRTTEALLRSGSRDKIRKTLTFHNVLMAQILEKYKSAKTPKQKKNVAAAVTGQVIRKYRQVNLLAKQVGMTRRIYKPSFSQPRLRKVYMDIRSFYERDDVSRVCPGVKDTVTRRGLKKQKRLLNDTIKNLHEKFTQEGNSVSYSLFCRLRPFWVLPAMEKDRQTCLCAVHENTGFIANAVKNAGLIDCSDIQVLASRNMCESYNLRCADNECNDCNRTGVQLCRTPTETQVQFWQWEKGTKTYVRDGEHHEVKITAKVLKTMSEGDAVDKLLSHITSFKKHWFVLQHQSKQFQENKRNIQVDECVVHVDFSENFNCRFHEEIQAVHFGGRRKTKQSPLKVILHSILSPRK